MATPVAVSPTTLTPGVYLSVDLTAAPSAPGSLALRALLMAPKSTAGSITANTQLKRGVTDANEVRGLLGPGTPGHLAAVALFRAHPTASLDVIAPTASAGAAATGTITFSDDEGDDPVTSARTVHVYIKGVHFEVPWLVGEDQVDIATKAVEAGNALTDQIPVVLSNTGGTAAIVTLTAKFAGPWGNDITYRVEIEDGAGGTATAAAAAMTGGTTEPDFSTALTNVSSYEYDFIIPCVSNADAASASGTSNPARIEAHIDSLSSGLSAKLQQQIVGLTGTLSAAQTGAIARNHGPTQYVFCMAGQSLGCEFAGWEAGRRLREEQIDPAVNRIDDPIVGLYGASDLVADKPTAAEIEAALVDGLSTVSYDAQLDPYLVAPITTYSQDSDGNRSDKLRHVSGVSGSYAYLKDLRRALKEEFYGAKIHPDLTNDSEELPAGVVGPRDIRAFVIAHADAWVSRGVLRRDALTETINDGTLSVRINDTDESQVDIVIPFKIIKPLAKLGIVGQRIG
jgi:phage tail sheath gpL-like